MVGGLKGGKGLARWQEVRRAVALQLGDLEPSLQQAALRCLKVGLLTVGTPAYCWCCCKSGHWVIGGVQISMVVLSAAHFNACFG